VEEIIKQEGAQEGDKWCNVSLSTSHPRPPLHPPPPASFPFGALCCSSWPPDCLFTPYTSCYPLFVLSH